MGDLKAAQEAVAVAVTALDKAAEKGIIHRNNAARRKSRLIKKLNQLEALAPAPVKAEPKAAAAEAKAETKKAEKPKAEKPKAKAKAKPKATKAEPKKTKETKKKAAPKKLDAEA
jgi:hypothetical protein